MKKKVVSLMLVLAMTVSMTACGNKNNAADDANAEPSKSALQAYAQQLYQSFAEAPAKSFTVGTGLEALAPAQPLNTMLDALEEAVKENLTGNEVE